MKKGKREGKVVKSLMFADSYILHDIDGKLGEHFTDEAHLYREIFNEIKSFSVAIQRYAWRLEKFVVDEEIKKDEAKYQQRKAKV